MGLRGAWIVFGCLLLGALASPAEAEVLVLGNGSEIQAPPEANELKPEGAELAPRPLPDLSEHVRLRMPDLQSGEEGAQDGFLAAVALTRRIPGSLVIDYEGLQGYVMKQLQKRLRKEWGNHLEDVQEYTEITDWEMRQRYERMSNALIDHEAGGAWWDRPWMYSLPASKGGAPDQPYVHQVGRTIEFLRLGPLALRNDMKARMDTVTVFELDSDPGRIYRALPEQVPLLARDHAQLDRGNPRLDPLAFDDDERSERRDAGGFRSIRGMDLVINTEIEPSRWLDGVRWRVKLRPGARLKVKGTQTDDLDGDVSLRVVLEVRLGASEMHVLDIEWTTKYKPLDREGYTALEISLLSW